MESSASLHVTAVGMRHDATCRAIPSSSVAFEVHACPIGTERCEVTGRRVSAVPRPLGKDAIAVELNVASDAIIRIRKGHFTWSCTCEFCAIQL